jgi:hypothetical protein
MTQVVEKSFQDLLPTLLSFVSTLIWQVLAIMLLWFLRNEIKLLLKRIAKVKYGGTEIAFQEESPNAVEPGGNAARQVDLISPEGFFTKKGICSIIQESDLVDAEDKVSDSLLIFHTRKQKTWLVATSKWLFCVLDDENTRQTKKLIQWRLPLAQAIPIVARASKPERGSVDIGPRKSWLYSYSLFSEPKQLEEEIRKLVERAQKNSI